MNRSVASAAALEAVDAVTASTIWLVWDDNAPAGVNLWVPLNERGERAILEKRFEPARIAPEMLAPASAPFAAIYHWGMCGFTTGARRSIMRLGAELQDGPLVDVDVYARVVTPEGAAAVARFGAEPRPDLGENFYVRPARQTTSVMAR